MPISVVHVSEIAEEIYVCELNQINANLSEAKTAISAIGFLLTFPFPMVFFQSEIETACCSFVYEVGQRPERIMLMQDLIRTQEV